MTYTLKLWRGAHMHGFPCGQGRAQITQWGTLAVGCRLHSRFGVSRWQWEDHSRYIRSKGRTYRQHFVQCQSEGASSWHESIKTSLLVLKCIYDDLQDTQRMETCCRSYERIGCVMSQFWDEQKKCPRGDILSRVTLIQHKITDLCSFWFGGTFSWNALWRYSKIDFLDTLQGRCLCIHFPITSLTVAVSICQSTIKTWLSKE